MSPRTASQCTFLFLFSGPLGSCTVYNITEERIALKALLGDVSRVALKKLPPMNSPNKTGTAIFLLNLVDASIGSLLICYQIILKYTAADVNACVAAVKGRLALHHCAVFFFYSLVLWDHALCLQYNGK